MWSLPPDFLANYYDCMEWWGGLWQSVESVLIIDYQVLICNQGNKIYYIFKNVSASISWFKSDIFLPKFEFIAWIW